MNRHEHDRILRIGRSTLVKVLLGAPELIHVPDEAEKPRVRAVLEIVGIRDEQVKVRCPHFGTGKCPAKCVEPREIIYA